MSTMLTKFICSSLMSLAGIKIVKDISGAETNGVSIKSILLVLLLIIVPAFMYNTNYTYLYTIIIYGITIFTYKEILNISLIKSTLSCGIMILSILALDLTAGLIVTLFSTINQVRESWYFNIIVNTIFALIMILVFSRKKLKNYLSSFIERIESKKAFRIVFAIILVLITISVILYILTQQISLNRIFTSNFLLSIVFFLLVILLLGERNNYENLSDEYDSLFNYVQIFEDWIEKEQLTRHEYKNQLAVLRCMTNEKEVKDKIDSIIEDFINIDNQMINQLKPLPNGGLKGLLYYKIAVAKKQKVNITVDVEDQVGKSLSRIKGDNLKVLTKLIGIYMDNAIEAAKETRKKIVTIEIYKSKKLIKIVISNSYNKKKDITNRYQKGVSTKGKGRGNGLYFANKMITKNKWIEENQEIINNFYVQNLLIDVKKLKEKM